MAEVSQQPSPEIPTEKELSELNRIIQDTQADEKDIRTFKAKVEKEISDLKGINGDVYEAIRIFWNKLFEKYDNVEHRLLLTTVINAFQQTKGFIDDKPDPDKKIKGTPRDFFEDIAMQSREDPLLKPALGNFGISEIRFLRMCRENPDRMLYDADIIGRRISTQFEDAINDYQNIPGTYMEDLIKKYNKQGDRKDINGIDLLFEDLEKETFAAGSSLKEVPAVAMLARERGRVRDLNNASGLYCATMENWITIRNGIEGNLHDYFKELLDAIEKAKKDKEDEDKKTKTAKEDVAVLESKMKSLQSTIDTDEAAIKTMQRTRDSEEKELQHTRDEIISQRNRMTTELEAAQTRLRDLGQQEREARDRLASSAKREKKDFEERESLEKGKDQKQPVSQAEPPKTPPKPPQGKTPSPKQSEQGKPQESPEYYILKEIYTTKKGGQIDRIKKRQEANGTYICMQGKHLAGRINEVEFNDIQRKGLIVEPQKVGEQEEKKASIEDMEDPGEEERESLEPPKKPPGETQ